MKALIIFELLRFEKGKCFEGWRFFCVNLIDPPYIYFNIETYVWSRAVREYRNDNRYPVGPRREILGKIERKTQTTGWGIDEKL